MIKVLVVDDSAFFRNALTGMLGKDSDIEVVGIAKNGNECLEQMIKLRPDVITLDVEMPVRDGLSTLQEIMAKNPMPVIMVSSLTLAGAEATLKALDMGAMDYIPKYKDGSIANLDVNALSRELCSKVKAVAHRAKLFPLRSRLGAYAGSISPPSTPSTSKSHIIPRGARPVRDIVAIGVSTGGPPAVQKVLASLPADFPACIFIAQHMPSTFTGPFAKRLDGVSKLTVKEAETGDKIQNGMAYVCPGGKHLRVDLRGALPYLTVTTEPTAALYKPSASVLMESIGLSMGSRAVGIMMTGMGSDGLEGAKVLKAKGGTIIAQSESSCVVYGMPKAVVDAGLADEIVDLDEISAAMTVALYK